MHKEKTRKILTVPKGVRAPERTWELMEAAAKVRGFSFTNDAVVEAMNEYVDKHLPTARAA